MAEKNTQLMFTPAGGMNQDDSIVTPAPDSDSGRSLFELGDYRYALNARIGSSRYDSFGDLENIKDTLEVTDFRAYRSLVTNPEFTGSLAPWLELTGVAPWTYLSNKAVISTGVSGAFTSNVRYQAISPIGNKINVSFSYSITTGFSLGIGLYIVFLNGTTIISTTQINSIGIVPSETKSSLSFTLPAGCTGVGFRVSGSSTGTSTLELNYFRVNGLVVATRPSGDEKVIGKLEDNKAQRLYYCVWNSNNNHSLRYYDPLLNAVFELFQWTGLKFQSNLFVKMAKIENWISFTDRNNSPRLINVEEIGELFISLGDAEFREFHISHHKWAPTMPPITRAYWDGITDNATKLKGKVYQWAYRYIYKGKLKSRFSPTSVANNRPTLTNGMVAGPTGKITAIELFIPGFIYDNPASGSQYNYFGHNDPKFLAAVEAIEIAYRDGQNELWRIYKTVQNTNSFFDTVIRFTGESNSTPIATDDFSQLFDTVPFLAGTVEAIDNRFVFGDCLDEHDPAENPVITNIGTVSVPTGFNTLDWSSPAPSVFTGMAVSDAVEIASRNGITNHTFKTRGRYKLAIIYQDHRGWVSGGYTTDGWLYDVPEDRFVGERQYGLTFKIHPSFRPPNWAVAYQIVRTNCLNISYFMFGAANTLTVLVDDIAAALNDIGTLPQDVKDRVAQHFDNARIVDGYEFSRVVREESDSSRHFMQYLLKNSIAARLRTQIRNTKIMANVSDGSRVYIDINNWYNASKSDIGRTKDNTMNELFYNYRDGDRVRFVGSYNGSPTSDQKQIFDELILEFTGKAIICKKPPGLLWMANTGDSNITTSADYIIEVYSPNVPDESDYIYYENGEWYPIGHPMTDQRHFTRTDWTYTNNAAVTCTNYGPIKEFEPVPFSLGDCTMMFRNNFKDLQVNSSNVVQVNSSAMTNIPAEIWGDWDRGNGRPSISYRNLPVVKFKETLARFSGQIIEDSFVNNINRFIEENQHFYPSEYGRIRDLVNTQNAQVESVGAILLAIGERETWSIYVNRITIEDLAGRTQVGLSDKVLGSFNALLGSHGTFNPESVSRKRGNVWFWDAINGSWVRYGRDGLTPISDNKMRNWFKELGDLLITKYLTSEPPKVISDFDPFNEELVTLIDHSSLPETFRGYANYKGAVFSENDKRWKNCHDYMPEMFAKMNNQFIGFQNGSLILHEKGEGSSTFYGVKRDVKIEPVFMSLAMMKSWQTLAVVSSHPWLAERLLSEYRGAKTIQLSNIPMAQFEDQEDTYWAAVLNDVNTPNNPNPIIEGNKMRSKAIQVMLTLDPEVVQKSLLHYVSMGYIESPKNPVN